MRNFNDDRQKELLGEKVFEYLREATEITDDPGYAAYIGFCILGSILVKGIVDIEKFDEIVAEIKSNNQ